MAEVGYAGAESSQLRVFILNCSVIDNHCHNIVDIASENSLKGFLTEARGHAAGFADSSVSFKRAVESISKIVEADGTSEGCERVRYKLGVHEVARRSFDGSNISALLIDDGLVIYKMLPLEWHKTFVPVVNRVLRLEAVAEAILNEGPDGTLKWTLADFQRKLMKEIDPPPENVVSFKSVIAYRGGLAVNVVVSSREAEAGLLENLDSCANKPVRLSNHNFLSYLFIASLEVATKRGIPLQLHTGFGDSDLDLLKTNPLLLKPVLEDSRFQTSKLVLLHAAYPYCREAGHLASVYPQVYVDFGLVLTKVTFHGMKAALHQLFELTPIDKLLYSSDAVGLPELFHLGCKWARRALFDVLHCLCQEGDLSLLQAKDAAVRLLHDNANELYSLGLPSAGTDQPVNSSVVLPATGLEQTKSIRMVFVDNTGQRRCRVVPSWRFSGDVDRKGVGITESFVGFLSFSDGAPIESGVGPVGEVQLVPDLVTRRTLPWFPSHEMVMVYGKQTDGSFWELCPRANLLRVGKELESEFGLVCRAGFESEFYLLDNRATEVLPVDETSYCSSAALETMADVMQEMVDCIQGLGVAVEQFHAESGRGQFEISTTHFPVVEAADSVVLAREAITAVAQKRGYRATFLPKVFEFEVGSGCHLHLSLSRAGKNVFGDPGTPQGLSLEGQQFMAGVIAHLPAIMALSAPHSLSYWRLAPNTWSGAFQCWGPQNREAAVRVCGLPAGPNFEVKCCDALANPYCLLAAVTCAGMDGMRRQLQLEDPVGVNPARLPEGHVSRLPASLEAAIDAFEGDPVVRGAFGDRLADCIAAVRRAEVAFAEGKSFSELRSSMILKY